MAETTLVACARCGEACEPNHCPSCGEDFCDTCFDMPCEVQPEETDAD